MGFFDELGSFISEATALGDDIKQTAADALASVTESTEELSALKDELVGDVQTSIDSIDDTTIN